MDVLWQELTTGLHGSQQLAHVIVRLTSYSTPQAVTNSPSS